jgi:hypothetical protein
MLLALWVLLFGTVIAVIAAILGKAPLWLSIILLCLLVGLLILPK